MDIFTPDGSPKMMDAVHRVYGRNAVLAELMIYKIAEQCVPDYDGGVWHFHTDGVVGFWVPATDTVAVSCPGNYYTHDAMDAADFGVAATLMALNQLVWMLHEKDEPRARKVQLAYEALYDHAYRDDAPYNTAAIYGFLD